MAAYTEIFGNYHKAHADDAALTTYLTNNAITPDSGDFYYNTTANDIRWYNGTSWQNNITEVLTNLLTTDKSSLVAAINEVKNYNKGYKSTGRHEKFEGDLNTILHNSTYNIDTLSITNKPPT